MCSHAVSHGQRNHFLLHVPFASHQWADATIQNSLRTVLGKSFFHKNKFPTAISLKSDVKGQIERLKTSTFITVRSSAVFDEFFFWIHSNVFSAYHWNHLGDEGR